MRTIWLVFGGTLVFLVAFGIWRKTNIREEKVDTRAIPAKFSSGHKKANPASENSVLTNPFSKRYKGHLPLPILRDSLVQFALQQQGLPYQIAGTQPTGFDCSGFVQYTFAHFGLEVPHSSALLAKEGVSVPLSESQKADLVIFTGTTVSDRTPGHVGIVIANGADGLEFVHASSNGGVKVSKIDSTGYARRFLQVRRLL